MLAPELRPVQRIGREQFDDHVQTANRPLNSSCAARHHPIG
jgi:hypothetical protein